MSAPAKANFFIKANGYWERVWQIQNEGVAYDITGYTFELEVKTAKGLNSTRILNLTTGDGITIDNAEEGKILVEIPPLPQITKTTTYVYDLLAIKDGKGKVWLEGTMTFDPGSSYQDV